jgi:hypothetical protein
MTPKSLKLLATIAVLLSLQTTSTLAQGAAGLSNMPNDAHGYYSARDGWVPLRPLPPQDR